MEAAIRDFLASTASAAMVTLGKDGTPHAVRVGIALMGEQVWSSGTQDRKRTGHLRRDPRATFFVYQGRDPGSWAYLTLEGTVGILEGPDVPRQSLEMFRVMQGKPGGPVIWNGRPMSDEDFLQAMVDEKRLIYALNVERHYGFQV